MTHLTLSTHFGLLEYSLHAWLEAYHRQVYLRFYFLSLINNPLIYRSGLLSVFTRAIALAIIYSSSTRTLTTK